MQVHSWIVQLCIASRILLEEQRKQRALAAEQRINGNVASSTTPTKTKMTMSVAHHSQIRPFHNEEDTLIYSPECLI
jgi:hypothetical protein